MKKGQLSLVMPNYQGENLLEEKIKLLKQVANHFSGRFIIVDDASTDASVSILKKHFAEKVFTTDKDNNLTNFDFPSEGFIIILKQKNSGFSSTCNLGVKLVNTDVFFLCNSDLIFGTQTLEKGIQLFENEKLACVTFAEKDDDGILHGRGRFVFENGFLLHRAHKDILLSGPSAWGSGGSSLFSKQIFDRLGGFREIYDPFYFEDVDLGYRAWANGYQVQYCIFKGNEFLHLHKSGAIKSNYHSEKITKISLLHQFYFTYLNLQGLQFWILHLLFLPLNLIKSLLGDRLLLLAFWQVIFHIQQILALRKQSAKIYTTQKVLTFSH